MNIKETISDLEGMLFGLHPKAKEFHEAIIALRKLNIGEGESDTQLLMVQHHGSKPNYDPKANMRTKTLFAIRGLNRFAKNKEIAQYLHEQEPGTSVKDFVTALSNPLFFLKKEQRIHKITVGTGNNGVYWGSAKWVEADGQTPKQEYMYIEELKQEEIEI